MSTNGVSAPVDGPAIYRRFLNRTFYTKTGATYIDNNGAIAGISRVLLQYSPNGTLTVKIFAKLLSLHSNVFMTYPLTKLYRLGILWKAFEMVCGKFARFLGLELFGQFRVDHLAASMDWILPVILPVSAYFENPFFVNPLQTAEVDKRVRHFETAVDEEDDIIMP